jgi:hypothetical protein
VDEVVEDDEVAHPVGMHADAVGDDLHHVLPRGGESGQGFFGRERQAMSPLPLYIRLHPAPSPLLLSLRSIRPPSPPLPHLRPPSCPRQGERSGARGARAGSGRRRRPENGPSPRPPCSPRRGRGAGTPRGARGPLGEGRGRTRGECPPARMPPPRAPLSLSCSLPSNPPLPPSLPPSLPPYLCPCRWSGGGSSRRGGSRRRQGRRTGRRGRWSRQKGTETVMKVEDGLSEASRGQGGDSAPTSSDAAAAGPQPAPGPSPLAPLSSPSEDTLVVLRQPTLPARSLFSSFPPSLPPSWW